MNKFITLLSYDQYYNPSDSSQQILQEFVDEGYNLALVFFKNGSLYRAIIPAELNYAIQQWLTFGSVTDEKVGAILNLVSPFEDSTGRTTFDLYYPKGSYEINGRTPNDFNGGYHTLASLYAALGKTDKVIQCFEAIKQAGQNDYFTGSLFNNYNNVLTIFYQFGHPEKVGSMVQWLAVNYPTDTPVTIYRNAVIRAGYISPLYRVNIDKGILVSHKGYLFPNLCLARRDVYNALADEYEKLIMEMKDPSQRNYAMAIEKKRRAIFNSKYYYDRGLQPDMDSLNNLLQQAVDHYRLVNKDSLEATVPVTIPYNADGIRNRTFKRKHLFIYPDYMEGWFSGTYHSDIFFNFIDKHNLFEELYTSPEDIGYIHFWMAKANEIKPFWDNFSFDNNYPLSDKTYERIIKLARTHPRGKGIDINLPVLILANRAFDRKDSVGGMNYYRQFDKENFGASRDKYEYLERTFFLNQLKYLCGNLALAGKQKEAVELAEKFERSHEKAFAYTFMAEKMYMSQADPDAFIYLDSVFSKSKDVNFAEFNFRSFVDVRFNLILLLSRIGGRELNSLSNNFLAEIIDENKYDAVVNKVYGVAEEGNFYRAKRAIPSTLTEFQDLIARAFILWQACRKKESVEEARNWAAMDEFITRGQYYTNYTF